MRSAAQLEVSLVWKRIVLYTYCLYIATDKALKSIH